VLFDSSASAMITLAPSDPSATFVSVSCSGNDCIAVYTNGSLTGWGADQVDIFNGYPTDINNFVKVFITFFMLTEGPPLPLCHNSLSHGMVV
jgi:hypothetical protein